LLPLLELLLELLEEVVVTGLTGLTLLPLLELLLELLLLEEVVVTGVEVPVITVFPETFHSHPYPLLLQRVYRDLQTFHPLLWLHLFFQTPQNLVYPPWLWIHWDEVCIQVDQVPLEEQELE
jgi:hypothetical protein